jgi:hypothetical protein
MMLIDRPAPVFTFAFALSLSLQGKLNVEERLQQLPDEIAGVEYFRLYASRAIFLDILTFARSFDALFFYPRALFLLAFFCLISSGTLQLALRVCRA